MINKFVQDSFVLALRSRNHAHAPYSKFQVGAAIKVVDNDQIFYGCNVENASFGGTICAERNAILNMVANLGSKKIEFVTVVCDTDPVTVPCALCLQVLAEFSTPDTLVHLANLVEVKKTLKFSELLPMPFTDF